MVSQAQSKSPAGGATTAKRRAARSGGVRPGSKVRVPLGITVYDATVLYIEDGRIHVTIHMPGVDEEIRSFYRAHELAEIVER